MKYLIFKSMKHFRVFKKNEFKYFKYKLMLSSIKLSLSLRYKLTYKLSLMANKRIKFKRRCIITGFSKSFRKLSLSRMVFREFASYGYLNGLKKSS
jgi:ribosomal protein S14